MSLPISGSYIHQQMSQQSYMARCMSEGRLHSRGMSQGGATHLAVWATAGAIHLGYTRWVWAGKKGGAYTWCKGGREKALPMQAWGCERCDAGVPEGIAPASVNGAQCSASFCGHGQAQIWEAKICTLNWSGRRRRHGPQNLPGSANASVWPRAHRTPCAWKVLAQQDGS